MSATKLTHPEIYRNVRNSGAVILQLVLNAFLARLGTPGCTSITPVSYSVSCTVEEKQKIR